MSRVLPEPRAVQVEKRKRAGLDLAVAPALLQLNDAVVDIDEDKVIAAVLPDMARRSLGMLARASNPGDFQITEMAMHDIGVKLILFSQANIGLPEEAVNQFAPSAGPIPFPNNPLIDLDHGRHQRVASAITRPTAPPILYALALGSRAIPRFRCTRR